MARAPRGHDRSRPKPWPLLARRVEERTTQGSAQPQARTRALGSHCPSLGLQKQCRSGPLWEPPLAEKGPKTWPGTLGYRVLPRCLPGPRANGGGPRTYGQEDADPRLTRLPSMHPGAGTRSQRWPPCPDGPRLERESRVTFSQQRKAGDHCPPCNRVLSLPAWRPLLWGPGRTGSRPMPAVAWGSPILARGQPNHAQSAAQGNIEGCPSAASQAPKVLGCLVPRAGALPAPAPRNMPGVGSSNRHSLRGTEAPDAKGPPTRLLMGAQETKGVPRRPQAHADLWRHPPGIRGPTFTFPAPGMAQGSLFTGEPTLCGQRGPPPLAQGWSQSPCRDSGFAGDPHGACHLPPGPESPTHLSWPTPCLPPGAQGLLQDTRRQGFLRNGSQGAVPGGRGIQSLGRVACLHTSRGP